MRFTYEFLVAVVDTAICVARETPTTLSIGAHPRPHAPIVSAHAAQYRARETPDIAVCSGCEITADRNVPHWIALLRGSKLKAQHSVRAEEIRLLLVLQSVLNASRAVESCIG